MMASALLKCHHHFSIQIQSQSKSPEDIRSHLGYQLVSQKVTIPAEVKPEKAQSIVYCQ
jgi:hypothetical protein